MFIGVNINKLTYLDPTPHIRTVNFPHIKTLNLSLDFPHIRTLDLAVSPHIRTLDFESTLQDTNESIFQDT